MLVVGLPFFRGYNVLKGVIPPIPTVGAINKHTIRNTPAKLVTSAREECLTVDRKLLHSLQNQNQSIFLYCEAWGEARGEASR